MQTILSLKINKDSYRNILQSYQLLDIYNQICKSYNDKQFTSCVLCDISKAFERVWHRGLLQKLKEME